MPGDVTFTFGDGDTDEGALDTEVPHEFEESRTFTITARHKSGATGRTTAKGPGTFKVKAHLEGGTPEPEPEGPPKPTLRIEDVDAVIGEASEYDTYLDNDGGPATCYSLWDFSSVGKTLVPGDVTFEEQGLLGGSDWQEHTLSAGQPGVLTGRSPDYPLPAGLRGHTKVRVTLKDDVFADGDEVSVYSGVFLTDDDDSALTHLNYTITASDGGGGRVDTVAETVTETV